MKVLIVGAGPTGLTLGVELARRDVDVEIIEKRDGTSQLSRAIGINPRSLELLAPSGVTTDLLAAGVIYQNFRVYKEARLWAEIPFNTAPTQYGHNIMLGLPQDQTEKILRNILMKLGGTLRYNTSFSALKQTSTNVTATTTDGEHITADYLIGADGWKSPVRKSVGIQYHGQELPDIWSIADIDVANWPHLSDPTLCLRTGGGMAAVLPLGGNRVRLISNTGNAVDTMPIAMDVTKTHRAAQFKIWLSQMQEYQRERVFLAGDSAHTQSPAGGRGMNLGIDDACDLANRLIDGNLDTYSRDRIAVAKHVISGAERMRKIVVSKSPLSRGALLMALKIASKTPALRKRIASTMLYG